MKQLILILTVIFSFETALLFASERPHIVFVLADDMGLGDVGCYGGTAAPTPHLDRLAQQGTRFTRYYSASPICSPSRCGLITGQFPARWHITSYLQTRAGNRQCEQADFLPAAAPSLPRILKAAGYATAHIGKWHLGGGRDVVDAPKFAAYGYDVGLGTYESPEPAAGLGVKSLPWAPEKEREPGQVARHDRTRWMVDEAIAFLKKNAEKPCFINLWLDDTHAPWMPVDMEAGADKRRANLNKVITAMDLQVGRLMEAVPENTLLIFATDNGALPTFNGSRSMGLRGSKLSLYEGGTRLPFIVRWPGHTPAGRVDDTTVLSAIDMLPTLAGVASASLPDGYASDGVDVSGALTGRAIQRSKALYWEYGRNDTSFAYPTSPDRSPSLALLEGPWKFLVNSDGSTPELYDLSADPKEARNLAPQELERVERMKASLLGWRRSLPKLKP